MQYRAGSSVMESDQALLNQVIYFVSDCDTQKRLMQLIRNTAENAVPGI